MTSSAKWSLVGVVVILAALVAMLPRLLGGSATDTSADTVAGQDEGASTSVISQRPDCVATSVAGVELPCLGGTSGVGNDKPTVVNLWAWWCEPCRDELPIFEQFAEAHSELNVIGVHADANAANGAALLDDLGVNLPSYQDDSNLFAGTLGLPSVVPITVVVSASGEVIGTFPTPFTSVDQLNNAVIEVL